MVYGISSANEKGYDPSGVDWLDGIEYRRFCFAQPPAKG